MESASDLQSDRRTFLAVIHSLQIIGEAVRHCRKASEKTILIFRGGRLDIIWDVVRARIPELAEQVKQIKVE